MIDPRDIEYLKHAGLSLLTADLKTQQDCSSHHGYICPVCKSGTGPHGTGMTATNKDDPTRYTCWACGTFQGSDIFEIMGRVEGISSFQAQVRYVAQQVGYHLTEYDAEPLSSSSRPVDASQQDYTDYYAIATARLQDTQYHRGLSLDTLNRYQIGYDPAWRHPKVPESIPLSPRLIIPTSLTSYIARDTRPYAEIPDSAKPYIKSKVGKVHIFNEIILREKHERPIFITEGELDALSILDVGGLAVGLGGARNIAQIVQIIRANPQLNNTFIIWADKDQTGEQQSQRLHDELQKLGVGCIILPVVQDCKDANEALQKDREGLAHALREAENTATTIISKERIHMQSAYQDTSTFTLLPDFMKLSNDDCKHCCDTGLQALNTLLDGGLYPGLTCLGSITGGGKTMLALQIADAVAESGKGVLYFSLEMSQYELLARSLSRLTFRHCGTPPHNVSIDDDASSTREILNKGWYPRYSRRKLELIQMAVASYSQLARNVYIRDEIGSIGVNEIRAEVERYMSIMQDVPLVVIDYLQILAPALGPHATDKQNLDQSVLELKQLSRDFQIPILAITSYNRANYDAPVNLASSKESGIVEYMFDTVLGLQQLGMDYREGESERDRISRIRSLSEKNERRSREGLPVDMEVKALKQRNGLRGACTLRMWAKVNTFTDVEEIPSHQINTGKSAMKELVF